MIGYYSAVSVHGEFSKRSNLSTFTLGNALGQKPLVLNTRTDTEQENAFQFYFCTMDLEDYHS